MNKFVKLIKLFLQFFKIGLVTFGGGYAMISVFEEEFCSKKGYITQPELVEMIALSESTPGPLAVNGATYIGYKRAGILGSIFATLGVVLPSFLIIFIISLFFDEFMKFELVKKAFNGIKCGVGVLILNAGIKMYKKIPKTVLSQVCFFVTITTMLVLDLFSLTFSAIYVILLGGIIGVTTTCFKSSDKVKENKEEDNNEPS